MPNFSRNPGKWQAISRGLRKMWSLSSSRARKAAKRCRTCLARRRHADKNLEVHSMRSMLCFLLSGLVLFGAAAPAAAHHAFAAEFDVTQAVKIKGTTTKMEW